ncbi:DUF7256 domain-containing protein [Oryzifoliimicrobium ureilyticus]|uniref:DUF7256 domain-containing protein n=1 Tax=Oryzifoliimicrobium ureilyticus TaxID=3113724 RepID=UPI0030761294
MDIAALGRLRPMMPLEELASLIPPGTSLSQNERGYIEGIGPDGFGLYVDLAGKIGRIGFYGVFPHDIEIIGLHIGMPLAEVIKLYPDLQHQPGDPEDDVPWSEYCGRTSDGFQLIVRMKDEAVLAIEIANPDAAFPEPPKLLADPSLKVAYDFFRGSQRRQPVEGRDASWSGGWSLGLPPGIGSEQWPLSPVLGHPLRHAFTLAIPEEYRKQGREFVALSLFVDDQLEELPESPAVAAFFREPLTSDPPADPALAPFWSYRRARHPMLFDMTDILDTHYAAIWLTQAEFEGALCMPPDLAGNPYLSTAPSWITGSYGRYLRHSKIRPGGVADAYEWMGGEGPEAGIMTAFPIRAELREGDPNIGKPAREWDHECRDSGYIRAYTEEAKPFDLERFFGRNHLGGTMFPQQGYPKFGPYYFEFEEDFGGFNFGGGNGQMDLEKMVLDWACG